MQTQHRRSDGDHLGQDDHEVHAAIQFAVLAAVAGLAFLVIAALWASTCTGAMSIDTVACGAPQLIILAFGAPLILLAAGCWAFVRTYRVWSNHSRSDVRRSTVVGSARRRAPKMARRGQSWVTPIVTPSPMCGRRDHMQ